MIEGVAAAFSDVVAEGLEIVVSEDKLKSVFAFLYPGGNLVAVNTLGIASRSALEKLAVNVKRAGAVAFKTNGKRAYRFVKNKGLFVG